MSSPEPSSLPPSPEQASAPPPTAPAESAVEIRPAALADLEAVVALRQALGETKFSLAEAQSLWQAWNLDGASWVAVAPAGAIPTLATELAAPQANQPAPTDAGGEIIVGYAELVARAPGVFTPQAWVAAPSQRHGIGAALLRQAEALALARVVGRGGVLLAQIVGPNEAAWSLLNRCGYTLTSTFQTMRLNLAEAPAAPAEIDGIIVRAYDPAQDEQNVYAADEEAFQDERGKTPRTLEVWRHRLGADSDRFDPALWFVAWEGAQVAGAAMAEQRGEVGEIMHVGVRRPWRRRGLGQALTQRLLGALYAKGARLVTLNVDGESLTKANQLYERMGFTIADFYRNYTRELPAL